MCSLPDIYSFILVKCTVHILPDLRKTIQIKEQNGSVLFIHNVLTLLSYTEDGDWKRNKENMRTLDIKTLSSKQCRLYGSIKHSGYTS